MTPHEIALVKGAYFSRSRMDSPKRFLKRLLKPRQFRFQSLLRGAIAEKTRKQYPFVAGRRVRKAQS